MSKYLKNIRFWLDKYDDEGIPYIEIDVIQCFRCKKNAKENCKDINDPAELESYWNKSNLGFDKAHIVPYSVGGSCHPSNMIFLCSHCHSDDLDVKSIYELVK